MEYRSLTKQALSDEAQALRSEYDKLASLGLSLDMSRGKPNKQQLDITEGMLSVIKNDADCVTANGLDCRNYGLLDGIPEAKKLFSDLLGIPTSRILVAGNSSLNLMYDTVARAMLYGVVGSEKPWCKLDHVKFLCPCPGYDRHFAVTESLGIEMIPVEMTPEGPDMDKIEALVANDPEIKGVWCVPKYSNPDGITYSDDTVRALAALQPAAKDFRVIWDNAYVVHDLNDTPDQLLNIFDVCKEYSTEDNFVEFTSTSKISFPGAGVSVLAASDNNMREIMKRLAMQTISYDKLNQLRHVKYFKNLDCIRAHMKKHAAIIAPKFQIVLDALDRELKEDGLAQWTRPNGGYFISLNTTGCSAKRVGELCKELGVTLTSVGATYPYGKDPADRNIRIAPTYPSVEELQKAAEVLCLCVKLATLEKLL